MGFDFNGFVLRAPRTATSNSNTSDEASNGVDRDFKPLTADYQIASPELVDVSAQQYRSAILLRPNDGQTEYLVWAANTANLADIGDFEVSGEGEANFPRGTTPVVNESTIFGGTTGSNRVIIVDDASRSISEITDLIVRRGDTGEEFQLVGSGTWNPVSGVFTITNPATLEALGGGVSSVRGDRATTLKYTLEAPSFWWSKNDRYGNRFKWDGQTQRWSPIKGTPPRNLGALFAETEYTLSPAPSLVPAGDFLPGDSSNPDSYCIVRIGTRPDAVSVPVAEPVAASGFGGIKVLTDDELEDFDFSTEPTLAGVVGQGSGTLLWNQAFVDEFAGQTIFYSYQGFVDQVEIEPLGDLEDANLTLLFVAPIPGPTELPFLRIGSRKALQVKFFDTEALMAPAVIDEGEVGVALSTGRLKFSDADLAKADPDDPGFDNTYLGAQVFYDGVSLSRRPIPLRQPVALVNGGGSPVVVSGKDQSLYIPDAIPTPATGVSGVLHEPDTTGTIPNTSTPAGIRFGNGSGLLREIDGPWDVVLFTEGGQIRTIRTFDDDDEIPRFRFRIPRGIAYVDKRLGSGGSEVILGREDLKRFDGEQMYFLQSGIQPSVYAEEARMFSRVRNDFVLEGNEIFVFAIEGVQATWNAASNPGGIQTSAGGTFTAEEIATSLNAVAGSGSVVALNGRVVLQTATIVNGDYYGSIEIGFGPGGKTDLSGPAALGFLPGWIIRIADPSDISPPPNLRWLPDNGTHTGVFRSPFNLGGQKDNVADVYSTARFDNEIILSSIPESPVVLLDRIPLEDVAGYDENIFFRVQDGLVNFNLQNYDDVFYEFGLEKFSWADSFRQNETVEQPTNSLFLGQTGVIANSFRLPGKGLRLSVAGQPFKTQVLNEDFILPDEGDSGFALLIETVGALKERGGRGAFTQDTTTFFDNSPDVDFVALGVKAGWQLKLIQGDAEGTYVVAVDATLPNELTVEQQFPATDSVVPWELYEGKTREELDLGIVADTQYVPFQHLPEEPFKVRVLSPLGDVPTSAAEQETNRLVAILGDALASGRPFYIRYGLENGSPEAGMVGLTQTDLGEILNSALFVPDPTGERFVEDAFSIRVGTKTYTFDNGDLIKVPGVLTFPLTGDVIEVQEVSGLLNFGADVFTQFDGQDAIYVEEFLPPSTLPGSGTVEYRASNGELNFAESAFIQFGGTEVYLVEQMIATGGQDVTLNPIQGSFLFTKPLREFQIVEVNYFRAIQGSGNLLEEPIDPDDPESGFVPVNITEQLPLFVRLDPATPTEATATARWDFNPTRRTVDENVDIQLYVGSTQYNVGSSPTTTFEIDNDAETYLALLEQPVVDTSQVQVTYAVFEAFGGEQTYTVSQPPVYRPPFRIEVDKTSFTLETDRTEDVSPGKFLRVAAFPFYITASTYDAATDITTVDFIPETQLEAGSRNPGSDSLSLISDIPLATNITAEAPDGFWIEVTAPYEPINRGFQSITFLTDLTGFLVAGHLLELGGIPFIVSGANLSDDGTRTVVDITSFFPRGFAFGQDAAKVSVRPVYQPLPEQFLGRGGVVPDEPFELILFGETDGSGNVLPGRTLRPSIDYELNTDDGSIEFLNPPKTPLQPTQSLYLRHTQQRVVAPVLSNEFILNPRYDARFVYVITPSEENNRLGQILRANYTFSNPDTFFYRTLPLLDYLGEVAEEVAQDIAALLPSQGPAPAVVPPEVNSTQGRLGLKSQRRDLLDTDRAARVFLDFYNQTILAFEQVLETITGNIIGDRDGKFKFFIGRDKEIPPPGYEDQITGELNRRNLFSEVFFGYNPKAVFMRRDPIVDPTDFIIAGDQLEGPFIDPDFLQDLQNLQREFSFNDVDDLVLFAKTRKRLRLFPLRLEAFGRYRVMGQPHRFSRIFPEQSEAFTLTDPGIGADLDVTPVNPGVYAFRKRIQRLSFKGEGSTLKIKLPKRASTFFKSIGDIGNPVLGTIENVGSIQVRNRLPRARVWAYSNVGFPAFDNIPFSTTNFSGNPRPAVIATPLPLQNFPIGQNGLPDITQLAAQGGEIIDLTTGDPELFTPAFSVWTAPKGSNLPKVAFGRPIGTIIDVAADEPYTFEFAGVEFTVTKSIFIGELFFGCILTFVDEEGAPILPGGLLEVSEDPAATNPPIDLERGDTVFVTPPDASLVPAADIDEPSKNSEKAAQVAGLPSYRINFDLNVDRPDGEYRDMSFPSFDDPSIFGLKEILGQNPPKPLSNLEASVTFRNGDTEPASIPALLGGYTNDSGDYTLPYLYAQNTELDQLGMVAGAFNNIYLDTLVPSAAYPNEILGADGLVLGALSGTDLPAAINTIFDATPVATAGAYSPNSGLGDAGPFDILFVQTGQGSKGLPEGSQGILSVGYVEGGAGGSVIEPPRFVTPTALGDRIRYTLRSAFSFVNQQIGNLVPGMLVDVAGAITTFDITQISTALQVFNDGTPAAISGGLNNIFTLSSGNIITINLWSAPDNVNPAPVFLQSVLIDLSTDMVTGDLGTFAIGGGGVTADDNNIFVDTVAPFLSVIPGPPVGPPLPQDPNNIPFSIPLWYTIDIDLVAFAGTSTTGQIETDRLTFSEGFDLRGVLTRGEPTVAGMPVFSELTVDFITSQNVDDCTVNGPAETNGGLAFTFLAREEFPPFVGTFDPLPGGTGRGSIRVMGFEGHGNTPILPTEDITFSAMPTATASAGEAAPIATGTGATGTTALEVSRIFSDLTGPNLLTVSGGDLEDIEGGDVLYISGSSDATPKGSTKTGTYLVKHAIEPTAINVLSDQAHEYVLVTKTSPYNTEVGWAQVNFPTIVSTDVVGSGTVVLSTTTLRDGTTNAWAPPAPGTMIYFIQKSDPTNLTENYKAEYTNIDNVTNTVTIDTATIEDLAGAPQPISTLDNLSENTVVTGFRAVDIRFDRQSDELVLAGLLTRGVTLPLNLVGFSAANTLFGFRYITIREPGGGFIEYEEAVGTIINSGAPTSPDLGLQEATPIPNTSFVDDPDSYVYSDIARYFAVDVADLGGIHPNGVEGFFPGDLIETRDAAGITEGYQAQAGIFLEPSWPIPVQDLSGADARVVDAGHSLAASEIGYRDGAAFNEFAIEGVTWEVRRPRRFHEVLTEVGELLGPLRYVYEIRRGTVTTFGNAIVGPQSTDYPYVITALDATQLGTFDDEFVNVNPGDMFRLFDDDGETLIDQVEIGGIEGPTQIWLKPPGITTIPAGDVAGKPFEIYLKQVPVPHEQSNNQLFEQITDQVLLKRVANMSTQEGGLVPVEASSTDPRRLQDTDEDINFAALGVQEGDIVVIDSAGLLAGPGGALPSTGQQRGTRTFGDRSVPGRTTATAGQEVPFIPGAPSELDDNRGWYRATQVTTEAITVSSQTDFSNNPGGGFVTFGVEAEYAVLPTISGSTAPFADPAGGPGVEGQMDLRPTAFAGDIGSPPNSFLGNLYSISPFSYTIIRPSSLFSEEAVDLVLLMRERTLSFLDEFGVFFREDKFGNYFVFQRDEHVADLGNPLIPDEGKGVMSNELIDGVRGLVNISPYANTTDSLGVLDRRFWVNDSRLDSEFPPNSLPGTPSYATLESNVNNPSAEDGDGRPVLTDRIDEVLDDNDQFRELRFAWLDFRVNRENGTLVEIRRFDEQLPKKRREELRQLRLSKSLEDAGA